MSTPIRPVFSIAHGDVVSTRKFVNMCISEIGILFGALEVVEKASNIEGGEVGS